MFKSFTFANVLNTCPYLFEWLQCLCLNHLLLVFESLTVSALNYSKSLNHTLSVLWITLRVWITYWQCFELLKELETLSVSVLNYSKFLKHLMLVFWITLEFESLIVSVLNYSKSLKNFLPVFWITLRVWITFCHQCFELL